MPSRSVSPCTPWLQASHAEMWEFPIPKPEDTDVDRFSLRQSVNLICATNRPDELDESFVRPGRIDREIHIGLLGEKERIAIFGVYSAGKPLAKDVDFRKVVGL
ncbi:unnamed protein product [Sphagnum compactum]